MSLLNVSCVSLTFWLSQNITTLQPEMNVLPSLRSVTSKLAEPPGVTRALGASARSAVTLLTCGMRVRQRFAPYSRSLSLPFTSSVMRRSSAEPPTPTTDSWSASCGRSAMMNGSEK